ncbi:MAG: hypothetical protein J5758_04255 [Abditibacteriota bacterium]|nr:hypothetical protein [Abditibacteriota bacterium]
MRIATVCLLLLLCAALRAEPCDAAVEELYDGGAQVTCPSGLVYSVTGYDSVTRNRVRWEGDLIAGNLRGMPAGGFNRLTIDYASDKALLMTVVYLEEGTPVRGEYYLEKDGRTFSFLTEGWAEGRLSARILSIMLRPLEGTASAVIRGVTPSAVPAADTDTCCLENKYLRAGIRLMWGGGVNYLQDKRHPGEGLANLINMADTGRLIQQSYYMDSAGPGYEAGTSFGQQWCYNPVQGGDRFGNRSRLIDFERRGGSLYVKAQPMDWALDGRLTPSYMENVYTLRDGALVVDNRFTDFSGMKQSAHSQEVPAFYTVSYLGRFVYYGGSRPWTGDAVTERDSLPFWGGDYPAECRFSFDPSNTERWSAWMSPDRDYGIGLFTPGAAGMIAGRHAWNGSKDPADGATNYTAPLITAAIESGKPLEYRYVITAGSIGEMRRTFAKYKDETANFGGYR